MVNADERIYVLNDHDQDQGKQDFLVGPRSADMAVLDAQYSATLPLGDAYNLVGWLLEHGFREAEEDEVCEYNYLESERTQHIYRRKIQ